MGSPAFWGRERKRKRDKVQRIEDVARKSRRARSTGVRSAVEDDCSRGRVGAGRQEGAEAFGGELERTGQRVGFGANARIYTSRRDETLVMRHYNKLSIHECTGSLFRVINSEQYYDLFYSGLSGPFRRTTVTSVRVKVRARKYYYRRRANDFGPGGNILPYINPPTPTPPPHPTPSNFHFGRC